MRGFQSIVQHVQHELRMSYIEAACMLAGVGVIFAAWIVYI
jgi:hypothetical protein